MEDRLNQTIVLDDGCVLGFAEYGDPEGRPIFYFHGSPSCRLDWSWFGDEAWALSRGVRFIAIDRPGVGLSDYQPDRRLVGWPDDVAELADALGFETFGVWGLSAGGPYAVACAWKLAQRLTAVSVVSGFGPFSELPACDRPYLLEDKARLVAILRETLRNGTREGSMTPGWCSNHGASV